MDIANSAMTWIMGIINTVLGWGSSFFGTVLPGSSATDDKKNQFVKYGLIVLGLIVAAKVFRVNIGGGKGGKK